MRDVVYVFASVNNMQTLVIALQKIYYSELVEFFKHLFAIRYTLTHPHIPFSENMHLLLDEQHGHIRMLNDGKQTWHSTHVQILNAHTPKGIYNSTLLYLEALKHKQFHFS